MNSGNGGSWSFRKLLLELGLTFFCTLNECERKMYWAELKQDLSSRRLAMCSALFNRKREQNTDKNLYTTERCRRSPRSQVLFQVSILVITPTEYGVIFRPVIKDMVAGNGRVWCNGIRQISLKVACVVGMAHSSITETCIIYHDQVTSLGWCLFGT